MDKKDSKLAGFPKGYKENRYLELAEKIVDGLIAQGIFKVVCLSGKNELITADIRWQDFTRKNLAEAISKAMVDELTYGNLGTLTMRDNKGRIVAKLYILPDGTLADDSWTTHGIGFFERNKIKKQ